MVAAGREGQPRLPYPQLQIPSTPSKRANSINIKSLVKWLIFCNKAKEILRFFKHLTGGV